MEEERDEDLGKELEKDAEQDAEGNCESEVAEISDEPLEVAIQKLKEDFEKVVDQVETEGRRERLSSWKQFQAVLAKLSSDAYSHEVHLVDHEARSSMSVAPSSNDEWQVVEQGSGEPMRAALTFVGATMRSVTSFTCFRNLFDAACSAILGATVSDSKGRRNCCSRIM